MPNKEDARPRVKANIAYRQKVVVPCGNFDDGPAILSDKACSGRLRLLWSVGHCHDNGHARKRRTGLIQYANTKLRSSAAFRTCSTGCAGLREIHRRP